MLLSRIMRTGIRRYLIVIGITLLGGGAAAQPQRPSVQPEIDKMFARWNGATPGCVAGADVMGAPVVRSAYGMADLEHDVPITLDTIFEIGSVSKQFTAAAVLLLARDGKLSLEDPIRKYIPEVPDFGSPITIRHILQHTSGLRDWGSLAAIAGWPRGSRAHTHAHVLALVSRQRELNFAPGTRWSYSNTGYNLAAILVERVSGTSFADFTKARIFDPLGMKDTSWRDDHTRIVKRRAIAYTERQGTFAMSMPFENVHGNGGLLTTVGDLLKWNQNFAGPIVGDTSFVAEMERRTKFNDGREHEYALGLYVDTYRGRREIDHSGGTAGYVAHLARYPDHQVSVAVLCNIGTANPTASAKAIADLLLPAPPASAPPVSQPLAADEGARFAGLYRSLTPAGIVTIGTQQDRLTSTITGPLTRVSATRFEAVGVLTFDFDRPGQLRVTDEFGTADVFDRVEPARPDATQLRELAGRYRSEEIDTTLDVTLEGERLVIRGRPDATIVLNPMFRDGFTSGLGWMIFQRDRAGRVVGLNVSGDRVWNLRFSRQ